MEGKQMLHRAYILLCEKKNQYSLQKEKILYNAQKELKEITLRNEIIEDCLCLLEKRLLTKEVSSREEEKKFLSILQKAVFL